MERDQAPKFMHDLLRLMSQKNGSDLFITANFPPAIKVDGKIMPVSNQVLSATHTLELARAIMNDRQAPSSSRPRSAISPSPGHRALPGQCVDPAGRVAVVCRTINLTIPTLDELGLPSVLKDIAMTKRGLVIFVGATAPARRRRWRRWSITATRTATGTSSRSRTRSSSSTITRAASSRSARSGRYGLTGKPR